jgi:hypothetical protein
VAYVTPEGKPYFHHLQSNVTSWAPPAAAPIAGAAAANNSLAALPASAQLTQSNMHPQEKEAVWARDPGREHGREYEREYERGAGREQGREQGRE